MHNMERVFNCNNSQKCMVSLQTFCFDGNYLTLTQTLHGYVCTFQPLSWSLYACKVGCALRNPAFSASIKSSFS